MIGSETSYETCHDPEHEQCMILRCAEVIEIHVPMVEAESILKRQARIDSQFHEREAERRKQVPKVPKRAPIGFVFY